MVSRRVLERYGLPLSSQSRGRLGARPKRVPRVLAAYRQALARRRYAEPIQETVPQQRQLFQGREVRNPREMLMVIQAHARARRTVIIRYRKQENSQLIIREIEPYSIRLRNTRQFGRSRYLYGFDLFRGEIRSFIVDNLRGVRGTNNEFTPRWEIEF